MTKEHSDKNEDKDPRVAMIGTIMGTTVAMLGICIPLVAITKMVYLPLFVIGGAFFAAIAVWYSSQKATSETQSAQHIEELEKTITDLKERLENVETINHFERAMAEKSMTALNTETNSEAATSMGSNSQETE